jgi:hypothetical protein
MGYIHLFASFLAVRPNHSALQALLYQFPVQQEQGVGLIGDHLQLLHNLVYCPLPLHLLADELLQVYLGSVVPLINGCLVAPVNGFSHLALVLQGLLHHIQN